MTEITVRMFQLGLLVLLWLFVASAIGVLRSDLFGTKLKPRNASAPGGSKRRNRNSEPPARNTNDTVTQVAVVRGSMAGTVISLGTSPIFVGRAPDCALVLTDDYSSNKHLRIFPEGDRWFVEDLNSTNGTFLGNEAITDIIEVQPGTQVRIGRTVLEMRR